LEYNKKQEYILMAKKRYINTVFWDDAYVSNLDPSEKLLFIYIITNPCTNISGIYQISLKRISLDTGIEKEMVSKIFERFQKDDKILYKDGWIAVKNFIKHQNTNSPLIMKGIEKELVNVPVKLLDFVDVSIYGIDTVSSGIDTVSNKHKGQGISQDQSQCKSKDAIPIKNIIPPTLDMVKAYLEEKKEIRFTAQAFFDSCESKGWMIGKQKMVDWQAGIRTWINKRNEDDKNKSEKKKSIYRNLDND